MYNRLSNYWYNEAPEAPPADAEEVRRRRLEQLESGPSTAGGPDAVMAEKPVPVVITEAAPVVITEAAPVVITKAAPVVITEAAPVVVKETAPDIAQWDSGPAPSESPSVAVTGGEVEQMLSRVFLVTVASDAQSVSQPKVLTMLLDTAVNNTLLTLEIMDQVLFERLSMTETDLSECEVCLGGRRSSHIEPLIIPYLLQSYARALNELRNHPSTHKLHNTALKCKEITAQYIGIVLLSNEGWSPQNPSDQLCQALLSASDPSSMFFNSIQVVEDIVGSDSPDVCPMLRPLLSSMVQKLTHCELDTPETLDIITVFNIIASNKTVAEMFPSIPGWSPVNPDSGAAFEKTILGSFLHCSTIRPNTPRDLARPYVSPYFNRSINLSPNDMQHSQSHFQQALDNLQQQISKFFYQLMKSGAKPALLEWLGNCLRMNSNRAQLMQSFITTGGSASDGFMLNLASVLLSLSTPFLGPMNSKLCLVDSRYCAPQSTSLLPQPDSTKLLNSVISEETQLALGTPDNYNFITDCFYITHRCLQLAYTAPFDRYQILMKSLMETQSLLRDSGRMGENQGMSARVRNQFEAQFTEQLEIKTHLLHPDMLNRVILFYITSCHWMSNIAMSNNQYKVQEMKESFSEPGQASIVLSVIPDYFLVAACKFILNVRYFAEANLENFRTDYLDHLVTFLVMFMNKGWVSNPHTRAEIAEALTTFIPNEKSQGTVGTINREAALCKNKMALDRLGKELIQLFVDIEHTQEFEHSRFQYRYHIFSILQYIWSRGFNVQSLSIAIRGAEEDTTILFTQFIKLLLNDANYLLDEALHNLEEIKKVEVLQDSEEWSTLEQSVREEKLKSLNELKRQCKSHNLLSYETVNCIRYMTAQGSSVDADLTRSVTYAFVTPLLVDTLVNMLNYYLKELVGGNQSKYKVKNLNEVKFQPKELLLSIAEIYTNLSDEKAFIEAIPRDGRSYSDTLFSDAATVIGKMGSSDTLTALAIVAHKAEERALLQSNEEALTEEAPPHYLDPLLGTLMLDPVLLPSSSMIVDRSVIAKHLLSDPIDPFNRQPLAMVDVVPQIELRDEIRAWRDEKLRACKKSSLGSSEG